MSDNKIGARQNANFKAVSTAPSFNKTPVGNSTPPLPYPTIQDLSNSVGVVPTVKFNGDPVYVLNQTTQPSCKGDDRGTAGGVKSGTVNGEVKPVKGSGTVLAGGKPVMREGDPCTMNGGNNPGRYITTQAPSGAPAKSAAKTSSPPAQKKPDEQGWWDATKREVGKALKDPWEATKGVARGIASIPSSIGEAFIEGATLQAAGEMDQAAALGSLFGDSKTSAALTQTAQEVRNSAGSVQLPKFPLENEAQVGGDKIATGVSVLAGGVGLFKLGFKGAGKLKVTPGAKPDAAADAGKAAGEVPLKGDTPKADGVNVKAREPAPKPRAKPRQPRTYEKKVVNEDGSVTYTLKDKQGNLVDITYKNGYPDFSNYKYNGNLGKGEVPIEMTGNNATDFTRANKAAGFGDKAYSHPDGYIWHHHQDGKTMQLIKAGPHSVAPHTGGASLARGGANK